jgi:hypothetical protein
MIFIFVLLIIIGFNFYYLFSKRCSNCGSFDTFSHGDLGKYDLRDCNKCGCVYRISNKKV